MRDGQGRGRSGGNISGNLNGGTIIWRTKRSGWKLSYEGARRVVQLFRFAARAVFSCAAVLAQLPNGLFVCKSVE